MKDAAVADTRNFALVGHAADGKTSLGEALLWKAGVIPALGSVTAGTAALTTRANTPIQRCRLCQKMIAATEP